MNAVKHAIQAELEQDALEMTSDVIFDRWAEVRRRFDGLSATGAAFVAVAVADNLASSAYDRAIHLTRFRRFLLEAV